MGRTANKKKRLENQIAELELKKRNGMMRAIVAVVAMVVVIAIKVGLVSLGVEWAGTSYASMTIFLLAIVAAAFAGTGTRDWMRAREAIAAANERLKKKR